jgi:peptidoglycan/xylan/chitin deacetylase (PgdA/CDA1 family)
MPERADNSPKWVLRRTVKVAVAGALRVAGAHHAIRALRRREAGGARVLVLSYHRATTDFASSAREGLPSLLVSAQTLRLQIEQAARAYDLVSLDDAARMLTEPRGTSGRDAAVVTFDDGYADNHAVALPILSALRVPATIFVATGFTGTGRRMAHDRIFASLTELARRGISPQQAGLPTPAQSLLDACAEQGPAATLDRLIARLPHPNLLLVAQALEQRTGIVEQDLPAGSRLLDWDEIRALHAAGIDIGGHSVSHAVLANLPLAEARREVAGCRDQIAERLGRPPRHFAYPNGYHTPGVRRLVAEEGFETAVTTEDRENVRGGDLHALRRKVLWENSTLGPLRYSRALAACSFEGVFHALGVARAVNGERPDAIEGEVAAGEGEGEGRERAAS